MVSLNRSQCPLNGKSQAATDEPEIVNKLSSFYEFRFVFWEKSQIDLQIDNVSRKFLWNPCLFVGLKLVTQY